LRFDKEEAKRETRSFCILLGTPVFDATKLDAMPAPQVQRRCKKFLKTKCSNHPIAPNRKN
jgi:hypothetical protein